MMSDIKRQSISPCGSHASGSFAEKRFSLVLALVVAAHFLFGASHIAFLPPWEGFDEPAHYSSIQQIMDTGTIPRLGQAWLSRDVDTYRRQAPTHYRSHESRAREQDISYVEFFGRDAAAVQAGYRAVHGSPERRRLFRPSTDGNWQAQHPPLFYLLMAPLQRLTNDWSWGVQLFVLRLASYMPAIAALAMLGIILVPVVGNPLALVTVAAWPVLFPTWFPEMARLGNDGLCALVMACIWFAVVRGRGQPTSRLAYVCIGVFLGLGLLTKGYFVAISVGVVGYLLCRDRSPRVLIAAAIPIFMGGWWYLWNWYDLGNPTGFVEFQLHGVEEDGVLTQFLRNITWDHAIGGPLGFVRSFSWSGTWSFALPGTAMLAGISIIPVIITALYGVVLWRTRVLGETWLPVWVTLPVLAGFGAHFVIKIAETALVIAPTPGWYMHVLLVPLGVVLASVLRDFVSASWFRGLAMGAVSFAAVFSVYVAGQQLLLFAGFVGRAPDRATYTPVGTASSQMELGILFDRLGVLGFPQWGLMLFGLAVAVLVGAYSMVPNVRSSRRNSAA